MKKLIVGGLAALALGLVAAPVAGADPAPHFDGLCWDASAAEVAAINRGFTGGEHVGHAVEIPGPHGSIYIGGDVMSGSQIVVPLQLWILVDGAVESATTGAQQHGDFPSNSHYYDEQQATYLPPCVKYLRGVT
jgi:hypothetical protein